ncbi:MAG: hypothetical protein K2W82_12400 [Candidatus Obscuribacterales bacterium]|nr:hypothetical protein [Candidatus Obscuribacterales bacterium]
MKWAKLGLILKPESQVDWLATFTGPSFAFCQGGETEISIYVTGRDSRNRSRIGLIRFDMEKLAVREIMPEPVLGLGEKGTFDENGTGYPWLVQDNDKLFMYYVGWIPAVMVPFHNDIGLAASADGVNFKRVSRAPLLPATDQEPLGTGSMCVIKEDDKWRMWYTSFHRWGEDGEHKHYYDIQYAESSDGINWQRNGDVAITFKDESEYAIGKPSVIKHQGRYHMWFVHRGSMYKIGYASSEDGISWQRQDQLMNLEYSPTGWDSEMLCYPHCFFWNSELYMLYNGNGYGKAGLGLALLESW